MSALLSLRGEGLIRELRRRGAGSVEERKKIKKLLRNSDSRFLASIVAAEFVASQGEEVEDMSFIELVKYIFDNPEKLKAFLDAVLEFIKALGL